MSWLSDSVTALCLCLSKKGGRKITPHLCPIYCEVLECFKGIQAFVFVLLFYHSPASFTQANTQLTKTSYFECL